MYSDDRLVQFLNSDNSKFKKMMEDVMDDPWCPDNHQISNLVVWYSGKAIWLKESDAVQQSGSFTFVP